MQKTLSSFGQPPRSQAQPGLWLVRALVIALFSLAAFSAAAATFTATLDRDTVTVGESATLTLAFEGGQPKAMPSLPNIANLQITGQGSFQNFTLVNGASSSSYTYTYAVTPTRPGDYPLPPLKAEVGGKSFSTPPLRLKVYPSAAPPTEAAAPTSQLAFMRLVLPKQEVFVGETVVATLELYFQSTVQNYGNFQIASLPAEGLTVGAKVQGQNRRAQIGNSIWTVVPFTLVFTPVKAGPLSLGPISGSVVVVLPARNVMESFNGGEQRQVPLVCELATLQALTPPKENAPATFNGAIGSYTLNVTAGPTNVAVGDPITVKIQIAGRGALETLTLPDQPQWHDFKSYPPTAKVETADQLGLQGTKTFEQLIVPQSADIRELPPISFSYFDTDKKKYQTLTHPAISLVVRPGGASAMPTIAATGRPTQDAPPPAQDIVSIKQRPGKLEVAGSALLERPWFLTLQSVPVLAFLGAVIYRKRSDALANNPRLRRQRKVAQLIQAGLNELRKFAAEKNSDAFFTTLFQLLREQIGERLDVPASAITEAVIEEQLQPRGVPAATLAALHELFQSHNLARYAPVKSSQELAAMIPKLESVLKELQEVKA